MLNDLPSFIAILFGLTTLVTLLIFFSAVRRSSGLKRSANLILAGLAIWLVIQAILSLGGFYKNNLTLPPRIVAAIMPPLLVIVFLFSSKPGRRFIDGLPLQTLTWLNTVRIPVEIGLYFLCYYKVIPELMTFEGRNFDIFSGITAPLIAWFGFVKRKLPRNLLLIWNIICLSLVLNVVTHGILAAPSRFQQLAFDQPNIAVLYFPFIWLPAFIVPLVIFTHLVSIRRLLAGSQKSSLY